MAETKELFQLLQVNFNGWVSMPPEKQFLINLISWSFRLGDHSCPKQ